MKKKVGFRLACAVMFLTLVTSIASADVKLPKIFGSGMVLQRDQANPIWGWADPGETVEVILSDARSAEKAPTDKTGKWKFDLPKMKADGKTHTITIKGKNTIVLNNVLIGEVWVCSGQSNMQMSVNSSNNAKQEVAAAKYPNIRIFTVKRTSSEKPQDDCQGSWAAVTPKNIGGFSAVAYYFGRHLHKKLDMPIGLINTSWGGTICEAWTSDQGLQGEKDFEPILKRGAKFNRNPNQASNLFDGMINPIVPFGIRGAIWYQGESNVGRAAQYRKLFPAMIKDWRNHWKQGDFPFLYVQLAPYHYGNKKATLCAELWDSQFKTLSLKNTGMAVITDIGNIGNIHPRNKQDVGKRLAMWALGTTYEKKIVYSGPIYDSMKAEKEGTIRLKFKHVGGGLVAKGDKPLSDFTIAGKDKQFVPAIAKIDGDTIVVSSDQVKQPVAVRFGWQNIATPNLFNKAGLPASPFRTDQFKLLTAGKN